MTLTASPIAALVEQVDKLRAADSVGFHAVRALDEASAAAWEQVSSARDRQLIQSFIDLCTEAFSIIEQKTTIPPLLGGKAPGGVSRAENVPQRMIDQIDNRVELARFSLKHDSGIAEPTGRRR